MATNMDNNFFISGIQQVGVGTENFRKSWNWFIEMFGIDVKILEDDTVAERMLPYTGGVAQKRHACIAVNLQGGGGFEIWQYSERKPVAAKFNPAVGDLGVFCAKVKCRNVNAFHKQITQWFLSKRRKYRLIPGWKTNGSPSRMVTGSLSVSMVRRYARGMFLIGYNTTKSIIGIILGMIFLKICQWKKLLRRK